MKNLGLDIGSSSIGWFIREFDQIIKYGVIVFKSGMVKGSGGYSSPTKDRREKRMPRNVKRARKYRKWALLDLLVKNDMIPLSRSELNGWRKYNKGQKSLFPESKIFKSWLACDFRYQNGINFKNPYEIRVKGLDEKLTPHEFGRALYHLVQRRGYKDIGGKDKETKNQIERRKETGFEKALNENRTLGEALLNAYIEKDKRARNEYPFRHEYLSELEMLCAAQGYEVKKEDNKYVNLFVKELHKSIIWQRPIKSQNANIGYCTLEEKSRRCPVSHPLFEIFRALSFINTIRIVEGNSKTELSEAIRNELFHVFLKKGKNFKFEEVRKILDKVTKKKNRYNYPINKKGEYYTSIAGMPFCKKLIKTFGDDVIEPLMKMYKYDSNSKENCYKLKEKYSIYDFWHFLHDFEDDFLEKFLSEKFGIDAKQIKTYKQSIPNGYSSLSIKALRKIIPFLIDGFLYNDAVLLAKVPEHFGTNWEDNKTNVYKCLKQAKVKHKFNALVIRITNKLIEEYKSLENEDKFALKDFQYKLSEHDFEDIKKMCEKYFGKTSWIEFDQKDSLLKAIRLEYQGFFQDEKRNYRKVKKLNDIFKNELLSLGHNIEKLYHHSDLNNKYGNCIEFVNQQTGQIFEILPSAIIPSIKNPMFNKSMSILRKLINELIIQEWVDEETKVIIEIPRGQIDDNNEREAYTRYTTERESIREKYREFLLEFRDKKNANLNVEEKIPVFELWNEQVLTIGEDQKTPDEILKLKDATERYDLWMEQQAQCMYTGKTISISQLFSNDIDIEHTIPRSILPDNTMANKTVCFKRYNTDIKSDSLPSQCPNFNKDTGGFTRIDKRLEKWKDKRDHFEKLYELRKRAKGKEDEKIKNKRIMEKHYYKKKFAYWKEKIERFEATEVSERWAGRQLVDTQMTSKYAREFLKTKFQKVEVVNAAVNVAFRKMYGFQNADEDKNRDKYSHHIIDASVLSLLPVNGSTRLKLVKQMYKRIEEGKGQLRINPYGFENFNAQKIISEINANALVENYTKDTITQQTFKNVRKLGKIQYLKRNGEYVLDENQNKILLRSKGDTIRKPLFQDTFIGKIKEVKRDENGKPMRDNNKNLIFNDEFSWVVRKELKDVISSSDKIVDPEIKKIVERDKLNARDQQGKAIRRVRIKVKGGKKVKERVNYKSKHDYKNQFYAASGSIPYALLLYVNVEGEFVRKWIPIHAYQIAQVYRKHKDFNEHLFIEMFGATNENICDLKLLKIGQKVLVLNEDAEFDKKNDADFQKNRLFKITQFYEKGVYLKHHLIALDDDKIEKFVKERKDSLLRKFEKEYNIPETEEDTSIENIVERKKDFLKRKYSFDSYNRFRLKRLVDKIGLEKTREIKNTLGKYKTISSIIEVEGETPLLKINANNINCLFENYDFKFSILGDITFMDD